MIFNNLKYAILSLCLLFLLSEKNWGQSFQFAFLSDTHVGSATGAEDLARSIRDINADKALKFAILTGDVTEFGSDNELKEAKSLLSQLRIPLVVIPGNHDATWSESGTNTFIRVFGAETALFRYGGFLFVGTASGPNMKMGPGQVPREDILWLDSVLNAPENKKLPIIFLNHYPLDSSLNNWYELTERLRKFDTRIILNGHGHADVSETFDGIPAIMGRSNLRANKDTGAYNVVIISKDTMYFQDKVPFGNIAAPWAKVYISHHNFNKCSAVKKPSYLINKNYPQVRCMWQYVNSSDIGSGLERDSNCVYTTDTKGRLIALLLKNGKQVWSFQSGSKVYSVPYISKGIVVFSSSNGHIYAVNALNGSLKWQFQCNGPSVASPNIINGIVYVGASDGHFRALDLLTGKLVWDFPFVSGFVIDRPLYYNGNIYFGCWTHDFYALDANTGKLQWKWNNNNLNRMYSPAACWPVGSHGKVFIVAPDRYMTSFGAATGKVIDRKSFNNDRVRESMGISSDGLMIYAKTMDGHLIGISTYQDSLQIIWKAKLNLSYEICPTKIVANDGFVFIPTNSGILVAVDSKTGNLIWEHKISNCMITGIEYLGQHEVIASTMDGVVVCLRWK